MAMIVEPVQAEGGGLCEVGGVKGGRGVRGEGGDG